MNIIGNASLIFGSIWLTANSTSRYDHGIMTRSTDSWIQQLSTLMGDFYQLLAKMQYLDLDQGTIDYPPYTDPEKSINTILATQLGLTPEAIQLLQRLPYVAAPARWNHGAGDEEFILYGCFADFRKDGELEESRDPLYAGVDPKDESVGWEDEDGQYMRPWYVPLSRLGNHGVVLILNMKNRKSRYFYPAIDPCIIVCISFWGYEMKNEEIDCVLSRVLASTW